MAPGSTLGSISVHGGQATLPLGSPRLGTRLRSFLLDGRPQELRLARYHAGLEAQVNFAPFRTNGILPSPPLGNGLLELAGRENEAIPIEQLLPARLVAVHNISPVLRDLGGPAEVAVI